MKIWLISQTANTDYDTYSDVVVCADTPKEAKHIHPDGNLDWDGKDRAFDTWCGIKNVKVRLIGNAIKGMKKGIICKSFHAG